MDWCERLWDRFQQRAGDNDFWAALSEALGHDHDEDDCLSAAELQHDQGWAWDCVREQFMLGRGNDDPRTTLDVAQALGVDVSGLDLAEDFETFVERVKALL